MNKTIFLSPKEVPDLLKNNSLVALGGFVGVGVPEEIYSSVENSFLENDYPRDLCIMFAAGFGDSKSRGLNHFAHKGLIRKVIGGHWGLAPNLAKLATNNEIQAYNFPQGVISQMFRDISAGKPGTFSHVGIGTFVDPDLQGGRLNEVTKEELVKKINIEGEDLLFFKGQKIDYALLRGTSADEDGNISFEDEALTLEALAIASATRNSGGKVFVQVKNVVKSGSINPKDVKIPSIMVDYVVITEDEHNHMQTFDTVFKKSYIQSNVLVRETKDAFSLDQRKIIARRCALMLNTDISVINYGIGMPESIALILKEEKQEKLFIPTVEPGAIGGTPMGGLSFGASLTPSAIIDQPYQFDFYDGGGLDMAFLGLAQCDQYGNINVSKFGPKIAGCGGFINITQNSKEVVFCGSFTAGGLKLETGNGSLKILQEGKIKKFIKDVEQITFSGEIANKNKKKVTYITERAVFVLTENGLELTEIAPGVDLQKDIIDQMEFKPLISEKLKEMDVRIFKNDKMNLNFKED